VQAEGFFVEWPCRKPLVLESNLRATLFGSGTTEYRGALAWATVTTLLESLTAIFLAGQLIKAFKGKGLIDAVLVADPTYVAAVAIGAALTVLLATRIGMPVSTTHAMIGGLISARRVAETMSQRITKLNHGQGFTANALAGLIIIGASKFGMPVSTTHVSCGALFGIGTVNGTARWRTIATILVAWVTTLPLGGLLGYGAFTVLR